MEHQRLCGGGVVHSKVNRRGKTPMEHQWLCGAGVVHNKVNGRGKTYPKWVIEEGLKRLSIKRELPSIQDLMLDDAKAREEDMKF